MISIFDDEARQAAYLAVIDTDRGNDNFHEMAMAALAAAEASLKERMRFAAYEFPPFELSSKGKRITLHFPVAIIKLTLPMEARNEK